MNQPKNILEATLPVIRRDTAESIRIYRGIRVVDWRREINLVDLRRSVNEFLSNKYVGRHIMKGGPFRQPQYFYPIGYEDSTFRRYLDYLQRSQESQRLPEDLDDFSVNNKLSLYETIEQEALDIKVIVEKILDSRIELPLVFKPAYSALGIGIFFLERDGQDLVLTMINNYVDNPRHLPPLIKFFRDRSSTGDLDIDEPYTLSKTKDENTNVEKYRIPIALARGALEEIFLLSAISSIHFLDFDYSGPAQKAKGLSIDPGMIEKRFENIFYLDGHTFETRHVIEGNLQVPEISRIQNLYTKVGGSSYFGNLTYLADPEKGYTIDADKMFDEFFRINNFTPEMKEEFWSQLNESLADGFHHYASSLTSANKIIGDICELQFDLCWILEDGKWVPGLIELHITLKNSSIYY